MTEKDNSKKSRTHKISAAARRSSRPVRLTRIQKVLISGSVPKRWYLSEK